MYGFLTALKFLTILPVPGQRLASSARLATSVIYFPVVGLVIGLILLGLNLALSLVLPRLLADATTIIALIIISGGLHLDGLIDSCDGLAAGKSPLERLQIMRDSQAGSFGIIGAFSILLLKYSALISTPFPDKLAALLLMPVLGRWAMLFSVFAYPYVREAGKGKIFKEGASGPRVIIATLLTLGLSFVIIGPQGFALTGGVGLCMWLWGGFLCRRLNGLTGDTYGAVNEVGEAFTLVLILVLIKYVPSGGIILWLNFT